MANISTEDLSNKNLARPLIRTMEDDLRLLKTSPSLKVSSPSVQPDKSSQNLTVNPAPMLKQYGSALPKPQADQEKIEQLKREKETEMKKKREEEFKKEREKIEQARMEKEKAEQLSVEKEMETIRKKDEELRKQREKDEYAGRERVRIEQLEIAIKKAEENRVKREKEKAEQFKKEKEEYVKREKETEMKKKREEEFKKEREKTEQARMEKDKIELAKREKEMEIKKIADEIKKEMESEIEKEKEKAEQVKIEMELEIKKEMEIAEKIKQEREVAMKKRVAEDVKKEMEAEIEIEKEEAKRIKKEMEIKIKKELEAEVEKEKELEEEIKREMGIDMRKEIADRAKKKKKIDIKEKIPRPFDKDAEKTRATRVKTEKQIDINGKTEYDSSQFKTGSFLKEAARIAKAGVVLKSAPAAAAKKIADFPPLKKNNKEESSRDFNNGISVAANNNAIIAKKFNEPAKEKESVIKPSLSSAPISQRTPISADVSAPDSAADSKTVPLPPFSASNVSKPPIVSDIKSSESVLKNKIKPQSVFSSKKNLSSFSAAQPSEFKTDLKKSVKNQYLELSGGYEHLSPEMRLARQGLSSFSADLKEGIRKDAELMDQDLVLKKKTAASSASLASEQPQNISIKESLARQNAPRELFSVFKTIFKIAVLFLLAAGVFYGIYYLVFRKAPADIIIPAASQSVLSGLRQIEISADFNFGAAPAIKEYIKNNAASATGVSRIIIKDTTSSNSLKINDFEKALGVIMPANFSDNLAGDYDLIVFNYPQNNYLRMGLALKVKNADLAAALAKEWEQAMFAGLSPLLFDAAGFYDNSKNFSENNYKNISIKYLPLGKNNLALNYAIDKNKNIFLFAASKEDIYYLIDEAEK